MRRKARILIDFFILICLVSISADAFADHRIINFQVDNLLPPFQYSYNNSTYGFSVDLANLIFEKDKYFLNVTDDYWPNVYKRLVNSEIDMTGLMAVSAERKRYIYFSDPVIKTRVCIYTRSDFDRKIDLKNLDGIVFGVEKNSYAENILKEILNIKRYKTYLTAEQAINALINNEVDAILALQEVVNYFQAKNNLQNLIKLSVPNVLELDFAYGISKSHPELVDYINKRLEKLIRDGVYDQVYLNYFSSHSPYYYEQRNKKIFYVLFLIFVFSVFIFVSVIFVLRRLNKKLKANLTTQERFSKLIVDNANAIVIVLKTNGEIVEFNKYAEEISGYNKKEVIGKNVVDVLIPDHIKDYFYDILKNIKEKKVLNNRENDIITKDKRFLTIIWNNVLLEIPEFNEPVIISTGVDITTLKQTQKMLEESYEELEKSNQELLNTLKKLQEQEELIRQEEERYKFIVENITDGIWEYDVKGKKFNYYGQLKTHFEFDKIDIQKDPFDWLRFVYKEDARGIRDIIEETLSQKKELFEYEMRIFDRGNSLKWIFTRGKVFYDNENKPFKMIGITTDITSKKEFEEKITKLAYYDQLTGLPNRELFKEKLSICIDKAIEKSKMGAVIYINIDNFKDINNIFGYEVGDLYLKEMAKRLDDFLSTTGFKHLLCRFGGDEFIMIIDEVSNKDDIFRMCTGLQRIFEKECYLCEKDYRLATTISIGISFYPDDGKDAKEIIRNVDIALRQAKDNGKNDCQAFMPFMLVKNLKKIELEKDLRRAIDNDEFVIYYQPIVDLNSLKIVGAEGLIRWQSSQKGFVFADGIYTDCRTNRSNSSDW